MEQLEKELHKLIDDEDMANYIKEAAESSETIDDFKDVAIPIFMGLDGVVSSEEDANNLAEKFFHLRDQPDEQSSEKLDCTIKMSSLIDNDKSTSIDPFANERDNKARKQIEDSGDLDSIQEDKLNQSKNFGLDEENLEKIRKRHLEIDEKENAQFKKGMGFRRPEVRQPRPLILNPITVTIGPHILIENATLKLTPGNRYGLVGRNGLGKTTLMKYISSSLINGIPDDLLIIHVQQEAPISERTVLQSVLDVDVERTELLDRQNALLHGKNDDDDTHNELFQIEKRLQAIGAEDSESRAAMILTALGFSKEQLNQPLSLMSGGFRMRVSLAQALYISPDVLLLDEPTGHLDAPSVCWLEEYLTRSCGDQILLVVSHDRVFLDNVCTHIIHLKDKKLVTYKGNWTSFNEQFKTKVANLESKAEAQKRDIDHKMDFVRRLGVKAKTAAIAQARLKNIAKKEKIELIELDDEVKFEFKSTSQAAQENIIMLEDVTFGYVPNINIFEHLNFTLKRDSKIVVIGENGTGKSTFINLLIGRLKPNQGFYQMVSNLRIAFFSQHHVDQLDYKSTPLQYMLDLYKSQYQVQEIRGLLGKFGLTSDQILQPIQSLSGGQKTRIVLASCAMMHPHLFLLDEVTNNLDMDSIEALGQALKEYNGAIVAVTHDQAFANMIAKQIFICEGKNITEFNGTFQQYREKVKEEIKKKFFQQAGNKGLV